MKKPLDSMGRVWDNSHMSKKVTEIRIRNATLAEKKRIALAATEADLDIQTFCLYAALDRCDKREAEARKRGRSEFLGA